MSLGGSTSTALDSAVTSATNNGVHVVVAAGNSYLPASTSSPARAPAAITVGASDINDNLASFSNYGSVVDIIAVSASSLNCRVRADGFSNSLALISPPRGWGRRLPRIASREQ